MVEAVGAADARENVGEDDRVRRVAREATALSAHAHQHRRQVVAVRDGPRLQEHARDAHTVHVVDLNEHRGVVVVLVLGAAVVFARKRF